MSQMEACRFLCAYFDYKSAAPTSASDGTVQLQTKADGPIVGLSTVARYISSHAVANKLPAPRPIEADAQIEEWLTWSTLELGTLRDEKLLKVRAACMQLQSHSSGHACNS